MNKFYLLDRNPAMVEAWKKLSFKEVPGKVGVEIVESDFIKFMEDTKGAMDFIVSPANSFGVMTGGLDGAITKYFGLQMQTRVFWYMDKKYGGYLPVGGIMAVPCYPGNDPTQLLVVPTMREPEPIVDPRVIYDCARSVFQFMNKYNYDTGYNILVPAFGAATGEVPYDLVARMMWLAYEDVYIQDKPTEEVKSRINYMNQINTNLEVALNELS